MDEIAIRVEGLGKRFRLRHASGGPRYRTFREELLGMPSRLLAALRGQRDETEEFWALKDVSFEVKRGEVLGIIGRNGAGKSTLLKVLSRIMDPTCGEATVYGRIGSLLEVGTGFHPELTGRENIFLSGALLGMKRDEVRHRFDEIVVFAGVEKFLDTPCKYYSSGMYARLGFAVAAHLDAEILLVDEVLAVGDAEFQKRCLGKMSEISHAGRTVLFVSHNMSAVRSLCSRAIMLENGQVGNAGELEAVIRRYGSTGPTTAGLVWLRPVSAPAAIVAFHEIRIALEGAQPQLKLHCEVVLRGRSLSPAVFVAVDIRDRTLTPIMQALPSPEPFIVCEQGSACLRLVIDLPPLIPGVYSADFWVGTHFSTTVDYILNAVAFEVAEGPTVGRSCPYDGTHGFLVPASSCICLSPNPASS